MGIQPPCKQDAQPLCVYFWLLLADNPFQILGFNSEEKRPKINDFCLNPTSFNPNKGEKLPSKMINSFLWTKIHH